MVLLARGICARYTRGKQGVASLFCVCFLFVLSTVYPHSIGSGKCIYIYIYTVYPTVYLLHFSYDFAKGFWQRAICCFEHVEFLIGEIMIFRKFIF